MDLSLVPNIKNLDANNFFLLAGPCAIEGEDMALRIAEKVVSITNDLKIPYVFKGSFRKANRSRIDSFTCKTINSTSIGFSKTPFKNIGYF